MTPQEGVASEFIIEKNQTTVGRHPSNDIVLAADSISRFHARIDRRGDYFILQDLNSSNGTMVNEEAITQVSIHHQDLVTFGNLEFKFHNEESKPESPSSPSHIGKAIVDIEDDHRENLSTSTDYVSAEEVSSRHKSSVISSAVNKKVDKATLFRLNQRLSALYSLSEMLRELNAEKEELILQRVLDILFVAIKADRGVILTRTSKDSEDMSVAAVKYRDDPIVPTKVKVSRTILNEVLSNRVSILSKDAQVDDRFDASESIIMSQLRSTICCPMIIGQDVLGVVHLDLMEQGKVFTKDDLEFVTMVASETGIALDHMRMQKEAFHRERLAAMGETVAGISHNVKNILLLSQGGAELLTRALGKDDLEGAQSSWGVVSRGIEKIGRLVREMLEYSSNKESELSMCNITEMICAIAEEVEEQLVSKEISLELDLDETIGSRLVDELGLQRTLSNLIVNSMEAISHQSGQVLVSTAIRQTDGAVLIAIQDNGVGIPEDKREKIFVPFFTTKGSSGTGLGLPMCRKCIEDMGGQIECESEENVGTTFKILLPPQNQTVSDV